MAVLDRDPVDRYTIEAREAHPGRAIVAAILGVLYALGWLVGKLSVAIAVGFTAVKLGFQDARKPASRGSA